MLQPSFVAKGERSLKKNGGEVKVRSTVYRWVILAVSGLILGILPAKGKEALDPPMRAAIVTSKGDACGTSCPSWIMLEGRITEATPKLLKSVLQKPQAANLPILISSSGGSVTAAMAMGRMIRKGKHDVIVSRTKLEGCAETAKTCTIPKNPKSALNGIPTETRAFCNSACPLVLAAGVKRVASDDVFIGLHQVKTNWTQDKIVYRETYKIVNGKKKIISRKQVSRTRAKSYTTVGLHKELRKSMKAYLKDMGVGEAFFTYMEKAPPSKIYGVTPKERKAIKLITSSASVATMMQPTIN
jgi:hypothetical protein